MKLLRINPVIAGLFIIAVVFAVVAIYGNDCLNFTR